jgi:hypothetical protein
MNGEDLMLGIAEHIHRGHISMWFPSWQAERQRNTRMLLLLVQILIVHGAIPIHRPSNLPLCKLVREARHSRFDPDASTEAIVHIHYMPRQTRQTTKLPTQTEIIFSLVGHRQTLQSFHFVQRWQLKRHVVLLLLAA